MSYSFDDIARRSLAGQSMTRDEMRQVLNARHEDMDKLLDAAYRVRSARFGKQVRLQVLINAKGGKCGEDCGYCSQSCLSKAPVPRYDLVSREKLIEGAAGAAEMGAERYCIVTAGRRLGARDLDRLCLAVESIRNTVPIPLCCSVGFLSVEEAACLREAGATWINHNLNTSARVYDSICTTHTYADRVATIRAVKQAGLNTCSGCIVGLGETDDDLLDLASSLRELDVDAMPVNFFHPVAGTPLAKLAPPLDLDRCLQALCLLRLAHPRAEIHLAGGKELHLGNQQHLALYPANAMFVGGYLTTPGQGLDETQEVITKAGFEISPSVTAQA